MKAKTFLFIIVLFASLFFLNEQRKDMTNLKSRTHMLESQVENLYDMAGSLQIVLHKRSLPYAADLYTINERQWLYILAESKCYHEREQAKSHNEEYGHFALHYSEIYPVLGFYKEGDVDFWQVYMGIASCWIMYE